ncbi:TetR family transcriptional regulator [Nocardia sp. R6R-6]|uniref:TetR family transcriptional regulator n=1 Tax=Nocardia sp. R6R-6 TaxID=3459303 RepID=UPI00403DAF9D
MAYGRPRQRMNPADRRAQIAAAARDLMIEGGFAALTLRAVAVRCGISLAAVQHHFADKGELFKHVIELVTAEYDERYEQAVVQSHGDPERRLRYFLNYLVCEDIQSPRSAGFFYELWSLAYRGDVADEAMTQLYDLQIRRVRDLVCELNPSTDRQEALARAGVIVAAADGLMLTVGAGKRSELIRQDVPRDALVELMVGLATQPMAQ